MGQDFEPFLKTPSHCQPEELMSLHALFQAEFWRKQPNIAWQHVFVVGFGGRLPWCDVHRGWLQKPAGYWHGPLRGPLSHTVRSQATRVCLHTVFLCVRVCILLSGLAVRHNEELKGVIWGRCVRGLHHRQVKVIVQKTKAHDLLHTGSVRVWVKFKDCPSRTRVIYYMIRPNCCDDHQHPPQQSEYSDKEQINIFWWRSRLLFSL